MKILLIFFLSLITTISLVAQIQIRTIPEPAPVQFSEQGVPKGELKGPFYFYSKIIEGTVRQYWLYIPVQYKASKPASVLVFQDGYRAQNPEGTLRVPYVLENLIAKGEIPVTIGVFISPGNLSKEYPTD